MQDHILNHSTSLPIEAIFPRLKTEFFFNIIYFSSSSLSSYLIKDSKLTIKGSIVPMLFVVLFTIYSVKSDYLVYVPSVKPYAEKDLQNDFFFLCISFC